MPYGFVPEMKSDLQDFAFSYFIRDVREGRKTKTEQLLEKSNVFVLFHFMSILRIASWKSILFHEKSFITN